MREKNHYMKPFKFLQTILQSWSVFKNLGHILIYILRINENIFICVCKIGYIITECICVYFIFMCLAECFVLYVYCSLIVKCFLE